MTEERKIGSEQVAKRFLGSDVQTIETDKKSAETKEKEYTTYQDSGVSRPTIGETTISSEQAGIIRDEVRSTLWKIFP